MKKILFVVIALCASFAGMAQNRFTTILDEKEYISHENELEKWNSYDFSPVILGLQMNTVYGIIGDNYKRIHIKITNVEKDPSNADLYHVTGKSKVGKNIEHFTGTIKLQTIKRIKDRELDENSVSLPTKYQGIISGVYQFNEPKDRSHSGVFEGTYHAMFQITENDGVFYNDLDLSRDSYINNMYQGFWTDYETKEAKICNWGDFRVPNVSADFDLGAGAFSPNEKYNKKGWQTYNDAYLRNDKKAKEIEENDW
ncbi:hypothetical protein [Paenimyroides aestuarii]|uniref:Uncharacterized protein n=1 Tax=Paenimyroides aestuarii TaxID=2968490 RepID=A0ABY5NUF7_9FLAO|nr:hypothetical protein [Paenimyroides aestuarii]UUV22221.1 hypothetical protein NPX36_04070 [Paenimyroides aestuarii]